MDTLVFNIVNLGKQCSENGVHDIVSEHDVHDIVISAIFQRKA